MKLEKLSSKQKALIIANGAISMATMVALRPALSSDEDVNGCNRIHQSMSDAFDSLKEEAEKEPFVVAAPVAAAAAAPEAVAVAAAPEAVAIAAAPTDKETKIAELLAKQKEVQQQLAEARRA